MNLKIFVDQVGRTVIGELLKECDASIELKNPCTIFVQPNETGQLQVQTVPMFFREFLTEKGREEGTIWTFNKSTIIDSDCATHLDDKLTNQYKAIITNLGQADAPEEPEEAEVVKLFDD
tara:strand:- start:1834 stop:2193 length:360 start_codon:yes stop_codon:yes gene_type:complete